MCVCVCVCVFVCVLDDLFLIVNINIFTNYMTSTSSML